MFEKKRGKRFLASVMALVMLLSLAPVGALAAGEEPPTNEECSAVNQPADKADQKPVVTEETNTANTNEETTPPPANEGIAVLPANNNNTSVALPETPVIVKPTEVLDQAVGVDSDTSKDNGIADYKGGPGGPGGNPGEPVDQPEAVTSITAEYWVTNSKVTAGGKNSLTIDATDATDSRIVSETGASVESLAPAEGTNVGGTAIFWQARVLPSDKHQTEGGGIDRTGDGQKIQKIRYFNSKFQYQVENNDNWTDFNTDKNSGNQLVFYYLIKTDFAENIQINVSDWPALKEPKKSDNRDHYNNYRKVTYQVYRMDENDIAESNPCDSKDTWYYSGVKISAVQVSKNELESCSIDRIEVSHTDTLKNGENPSVDSSSNADFRIDLSKVPAHINVVVKIYVKVNKYLVTYKSDGEVFHREAYKATTEVNQLTRIPKKEGFTFKGWTSEDVTVSNNKFTMPAKDVVFTAVWEENKTPVTPTEPTKAVDAKYFVLLPGRGTPASGKDQGTSYYLPNKTSDGGVSGKNDDTGYPGGLTAEGKSAADQNYNYSDDKNGVFNSAGVPNNYLVVPDDLGFFTASNWKKDGQYNKNTNTTNLSTVLGETFNVNNVRIIWYAIKWQRDGYHVDGYVAGIPVTLTYHDNFTGSNDSYIWDGLTSGETASIAQNGTVSGSNSGSKTFSHEGYEFRGWYDNAACTGTNYAGQTHTMMDNLNLYAKWEPATTLSYTVNYLEKNTNEVVKTAKTANNQTFGTQITATSEAVEIDGYTYVEADKPTLTIGTGENVINLYYTKRNDLSYTVNYLEKNTNEVVKTAKTANNQTFGTQITATSEAVEIDGYTYVEADKPALTIGTGENVINLYYTKRNDLSYTVNYLEKNTNEVVKTAKTANNQTFGTQITATSEAVEIDGYTYVEADKPALTIGTGENVINLYYTKRNDLSYTVNYLEKNTNEVVKTAKTANNQTFGTQITATSEAVEIDGYTYVEADKPALTIGTGENVINLYYTKRNDLSYTVNYLEKNTNEVVKTAKTANNQTFGTQITATSEAVEIDGYTYVEADKPTLTIGTGENVINLYYTKRNDLSYTVNYLEKNTNEVVKTAKTANNQTFGTQITATSEAVEIDGYTYVEADKPTLTIGTGENVINLYYTKATQYKITIYYVDDAQKTLQDDAVIDGKYQNDSYDVTTQIPDRIGDYVKESVNGSITGTVTDNVEITVVYTKDVLVDPTAPGPKPEKGPGDNIPDKYQVTINYVSSNTNWGSVNRSKEVITLINKESNKWAETGTVTAPSCTATSAGGKCYFVNWTKKQEGSTASSTVISSANLPEQTIKNAKGGDVYTFTANFDRSSGGGGGSNRPKPPVVEIPDDVPTGLNGKDHYAYIIGYGNNDVRPQNNITRAEVATIFFRLLTDETREANMTKSNGYNDVKDGDWFCCAVSTLSKMGIIKGYEDGSFKPNDPISRAEFAAIAARFDPDGDKTPATFADVTSHWAKDEISIAANHGWIKGYEDGSFKPDQKITRAETMTLVNRVLNRLPEAKDDLHKDMKTWVDNMDETAWYYLAVQEATNSHYFKNKTSTKFEQWTDLRDTRDWSELEK